jgi:hypothetical protein
MWCIEKIICIFNNILQKISSQKSFIWKNKNDHKKNKVLESCVIVGSFDYDCTPWSLDGDQKNWLLAN